MSPRQMLKISIATVLAVASAQVLAGEGTPPPDTSEWKCSACPFDKGYQADVTVGAIHADGANAASGRFTGIDKQKTYVDAGAQGTYAGDNGQFATYTLDNLGLDSRSGAIRFGRYGQYDVGLKYDGIPNRRYDSTVTPFSGGADQTLPTDWVAAGSTAGMTDLAAALHTVDIGTLRKTYGIAGRWMPGHGITLFGSFERQDKTGSQILGAGFLTQALQLAAPVSFKTDTFEVGAAWSGNDVAWRFSASDSKFRNDDLLLTFQNPYLSLLEGAPNGAVSLAPENDARSWNFALSAALPMHSSVSIAAGTSKLTQSSPLAPVTAQPGALPPEGAFEGDVRLSHLAATLGSRPWSRVHVHGRVALDSRTDDGTAMSLVQYLTDYVAGPTVTTPRFDFKRVRVDGGVDLKVLNSLTVGVAGDRIEIDRTQQLVAHTEDGRTYGRVKWTPGHGFTLTVKGGAAHREARDVDLTYLPFGQDPRVAMFNVSNRDREFGDADASWSLGDKFSIALQGSVTHDDYRRSQLGLLSGRERRAAATVTWTPTEALSFYVDGGYQKRDTRQAGAYSPTSAIWEASISDRFQNAGAGARYTAERWNGQLDLAHAKSVGATAVGLSGMLAGYPDVSPTFDSARFTLGYAATERLNVRIRYVYQNYAALDWAADGVTPTTALNLLALGAASGTYNTNILGLSFNYKFGGKAAP
jgi:MtrB/PioB family decaheme-associated outer membrane protein